MPLTPKNFGALGGDYDDTEALQSFLNALGNGIDGVIDQAYRHSTLLGMSGQSNFRLGGHGSLTMIDGASVNDAGGGIRFIGCSDFVLQDFSVYGNRANRTPANAGAHLINFRSCKRFTVERVKAYDSCTDGFYMGSATPADKVTHSSQFAFIDCVADNCYRQGMSIIQGNHGRITGGSFTNTNGGAPQAGIDLESNDADAENSIEDITLSEVYFEGNVGAGLLVSSRCNPRDIKIVRCTFKDSGTKAIDWGCTANGVIEDCIFDGAGNSITRGVIDIPNQPSVGDLEIIRPLFRNMTFDTTGQWLVYVDSASSGKVRITGLKVDTCYQVASLGRDCVFEDGRVSSTVGNKGVFVAGPRCKVRRNIISGFAYNAIFANGADAEITDNALLEPTVNNSSGVLRVLQAGGVVDRNLIARASSAAGYGIRVDAGYRSLQDNRVEGFTGNPLYLTGAAGTEAVGFKKGNIVNGARATEN